MYNWSVPLCKLKNDPSPARAQVQELRKTSNAASAKTASAGATMPGAEDAMALTVPKLINEQGMSPHVWLMGAIKLCQ